MQKFKLICFADVLMGLNEIVKQSQFLLLLIQINHLGIHQFLFQRQHCKKFFLNELFFYAEDGGNFFLNLLVNIQFLP